jgi:glycosyltransferase involved in cell wall biosynthesis
MFKISIITITFNSEETLEQTIESVASQTYPNIEYIVVDGGSTDRTLDIIKKHEGDIDRWISEQDDGIADAFNKGVSLATGDFVYFLNSDDYLEADSLAKIAAEMSLATDIYFCSFYLECEGEKTLYDPGRFNFLTNFKLGLSHQSTLCSRALFEEIGLFDTSFSLTMDYDLFMRAYRRGIKPVRIDEPIGTMRLSGLTSERDWPSLRRRFKEERRVHLKNCETRRMRAVYEVYWLLYWPYRRILSVFQ